MWSFFYPPLNCDWARGDRGLGSSWDVRYGCMMASLGNKSAWCTICTLARHSQLRTPWRGKERSLETAIVRLALDLPPPYFIQRWNVHRGLGWSPSRIGRRLCTDKEPKPKGSYQEWIGNRHSLVNQYFILCYFYCARWNFSIGVAYDAGAIHPGVLPGQ